MKQTVATAILVVGFAQVVEASDRPASPTRLAAPIVAPLSDDADVAPTRPTLVRGPQTSLIRSPGGQLATTLALIVFAFLIARFASRRAPPRDEHLPRS